jgi:hypothetical protein
MAELVLFDCKACRALLGIEYRHQGQMATCPVCKSSVPVPVAPPETDPTVDMQVSLPGGPGFSGTVSRSDSGKLAFTILGGLLTVTGVILGVRIRGKR